MGKKKKQKEARNEILSCITNRAAKCVKERIRFWFLVKWCNNSFFFVAVACECPNKPGLPKEKKTSKQNLLRASRSTLSRDKSNITISEREEQ